MLLENDRNAVITAATVSCPRNGHNGRCCYYEKSDAYDTMCNGCSRPAYDASAPGENRAELREAENFRRRSEVLLASIPFIFCTGVAYMGAYEVCAVAHYASASMAIHRPYNEFRG